MHMMEKTDH